MCTVSWIHEDDGYHLLCNRDEKKERPPARPPRVDQRGWVRFIAPVDRQSGGSWIGVNEFGVSVCLLNGASPGNAATALRSRGLIVRDLIWAESTEDCALWLNQLDLSRVAPFTVLLLQPGTPAIIGAWNGEYVDVNRSAESHMPLTSSSYDPNGASEIRRHEFQRLTAAAGLVDVPLLYAFHSGHGPAPSAYSPCMHRPDAETVSFSHIAVTPKEIRFSYWPTAPCRLAAGDVRVLHRAA
jgi:hypothetical protein